MIPDPDVYAIPFIFLNVILVLSGGLNPGAPRSSRMRGYAFSHSSLAWAAQEAISGASEVSSVIWMGGDAPLENAAWALAKAMNSVSENAERVHWSAARRTRPFRRLTRVMAVSFWLSGQESGSRRTALQSRLETRPTAPLRCRVDTFLPSQVSTGILLAPLVDLTDCLAARFVQLLGQDNLDLGEQIAGGPGLGRDAVSFYPELRSARRPRRNVQRHRSLGRGNVNPRCPRQPRPE